jgi:hypothetical protein
VAQIISRIAVSGGRRKETSAEAISTFVIGVLQAFVALSCNLSKYLSKMKFDHVYCCSIHGCSAQDDTVTDDLFQGNNDDTNSDGATINNRL